LGPDVIEVGEVVGLTAAANAANVGVAAGVLSVVAVGMGAGVGSGSICRHPETIARTRNGNVPRIIIR